MEPYFLYLKDNEKFKNFIDYYYSHYTEPREKNKNIDPSSIMKDYNVDYLVFFWNIRYKLNDNYHVNYILTDKVNNINNNDNFEVIYNNWNDYIWKVIY